MPQISRRWSNPRVDAKIQRLLVDCITRCSNQNAAANFVDVLLTKTEKTMIAKRIAIALMLVKGYTPPEIDEKLKVSITTVYTVKIWLESKGAEYQKMLEDIARKDREQEKQHQSLKEDAQSFFSLRPKTNWKEQRRQQWKKVKETTVPF